MFGAAPKAMAASPVSISGTGGSATATSDADGTYTLQVDEGTHVLKAAFGG